MKTISILIMLLAFSGLNAQHGTVATGGNATGQNGSTSYSVGQVDYITVAGSGGTVTQGVQQPYEIFVVGIGDNQDISLEMSAYPNPTAGEVILRVENSDIKGLSYRIYDQNGRMLLKQELEGSVTTVPMQNLSAGTYLLKVFDKRTEIKTFKIIKK